MKIRSLFALALCCLIAYPVSTYGISPKVITFGSIGAIATGIGGIALLEYMENKYNQELLKDDLSEDRRNTVERNIKICHFLMGTCGIGIAAGVVGTGYGIWKWTQNDFKGDLGKGGKGNKGNGDGGNRGNDDGGNGYNKPTEPFVKEEKIQPSNEVLNQKECPVCMTTDYEKGNNTILSCGHRCCNDCLNRMIDLSLKEKTSEHIKCPIPNCKKGICMEDLKLITKNDNKKIVEFNDIFTKEWLAKQGNVKYCKTPNCPYSFINDEDEAFKVTCPHCNQAYCAKCLKDHSMSMGCDVTGKTKEQLEKDNEDWIKKNTKNCPNCKKPIQRNGGCLYITCPCKHQFCFNCLDPHHHVFKCDRPEKY